jgi:Protein of unknown function (DUF3106)
MSRSRQTFWWLALMAAGQFAAFQMEARNSTDVPAPVTSFISPTNSLPAAARGKSPVDFFRQLLAMTPAERDDFLTNHPPKIRARILAKVGEYEALNPNERELRLRATELRWYLVPLMRESSTNRALRLAQVPDDIRDLVNARLEEWRILPPPLQQEFLENEHILRYFAHVDVSNSPSENLWREPSAADRAHWDALPEAERRQVASGFNQFFGLTPDEKQNTLNTLSEAERRQMEKTLQTFEKMPAAQRTECINAFAKFAGMNAPDRAEFLKNAARWSEMSPAERQTWRDLVVNVPQWPPLPVGFMVPIPGESNNAAITNSH